MEATSIYAPTKQQLILRQILKTTTFFCSNLCSSLHIYSFSSFHSHLFLYKPPPTIQQLYNYHIDQNSPAIWHLKFTLLRVIEVKKHWNWRLFTNGYNVIPVGIKIFLPYFKWHQHLHITAKHISAWHIFIKQTQMLQQSQINIK